MQPSHWGIGYTEVQTSNNLLFDHLYTGHLLIQRMLRMRRLADMEAHWYRGHLLIRRLADTEDAYWYGWCLLILWSQDACWYGGCWHRVFWYRSLIQVAVTEDADTDKLLIQRMLADMEDEADTDELLVIRRTLGADSSMMEDEADSRRVADTEDACWYRRADTEALWYGGCWYKSLIQITVSEDAHKEARCWFGGGHGCWCPPLVILVQVVAGVAANYLPP